MKVWLNLVNAVLFAATGCLWIRNALEHSSGFYILLALVWLTGAGIWFLRFIKERKESKKEK